MMDLKKSVIHQYPNRAMTLKSSDISHPMLTANINKTVHDAAVLSSFFICLLPFHQSRDEDD
jgi:hypothetical protein